MAPLSHAVFTLNYAYRESAKNIGELSERLNYHGVNEDRARFPAGLISTTLRVYEHHRP